jgi:hypothetical protein
LAFAAACSCTQPDGSWKCKHDEPECAGNLQQLCVQQYSKEVNRYNWLMNFILCNNKEGMDQTGSFATATKCLKVRKGSLCAVLTVSDACMQTVLL